MAPYWAAGADGFGTGSNLYTARRARQTVRAVAAAIRRPRFAADCRGARMTDARFDLVALGEPLLEFNQTRGDDAISYLQGFGGDTSNWRSPPRGSARARPTSRGWATTRSAACSSSCGAAKASTSRGVAIDADAPTGIYFVTHGDARPRVQLSSRRLGGEPHAARPICRST